MRICVSGTMMLGDRTEVIDFIRAHGGTWSSTVSATTNVLVIHPNELSPPTHKVRNAQAHGTPIVNEKWLTDSVALGRVASVAPYVVKKSTPFAFLAPLQSFADVVFGLAGGIVGDVVAAIVFVAAFLLAVPWRMVLTFFAISWRAPQDRDRAFYRGLAAAALVEWLTVGALILAHEQGLLTISREVAAALCISGAFGARYFAKRRTQLGFPVDASAFAALFENGVRHHAPWILFALYVACAFVVMGPVSVILDVAQSNAFKQILLFLTAIRAFVVTGPVSVVLDVAQSSAFKQTILFLTAIPLRVIPVAIVVLTSKEEKVQFDSHLGANLFDWAVCAILYFTVPWHLVPLVPLSVSLFIGVWLAVGALYSWRYLITHSVMTEMLRVPVSVNVAWLLAIWSVGWVVHLALKTARFLQPVLAPIGEAVGNALSIVLRHLANVCDRVFVRPVAAILQKVEGTFRWAPFEAVGRALALALVVLFIIVTVYRIPALYKAFRDRADGETTSATIWRAVERERAWIQSASEQRANRWKAVAERKRLQKAKASRAIAVDRDEEEEEEEELVPVVVRRRGRGASRSPARKATASRSVSKSPSRR